MPGLETSVAEPEPIEPQESNDKETEVLPVTAELHDTIKEITFSKESDEYKLKWNCRKVLIEDLRRMRIMYPSTFRNIERVDFVFQGFSQIMKEPYYIAYCYTPDGKMSNLGQFDIHRETNGNLYVKGPA